MEFNSSTLFHIPKNSSQSLNFIVKHTLKKYIVIQIHAVAAIGNAGASQWERLDAVATSALLRGHVTG